MQIHQQTPQLISRLRVLVDLRSDTSWEALRDPHLLDESGDARIAEGLVAQARSEEVRVCEAGPLAVEMRFRAAVVAAVLVCGFVVAEYLSGIEVRAPEGVDVCVLVSKPTDLLVGKGVVEKAFGGWGKQVGVHGY